MKIFNLFLFICNLVLSLSISAQNISGNLSLLTNQTIKLEGFKGLQTYPISNTTIDEKGNFKLTCDNSDFGVGYFIQIRKIIYDWLN